MSVCVCVDVCECVRASVSGRGRCALVASTFAYITQSNPRRISASGKEVNIKHFNVVLGLAAGLR